MQPDRTLAKAQRLALVFRAAGTTWALPASSVLEVAPLPPLVQGGAPIQHDGVEVEDFCSLVGEPARAAAPGFALRVDTEPPRAFAIDAVEEFADLTQADHLGLPGGSILLKHGLVRGAVLNRGRLVLELVPEVLARLAPHSLPRPTLATPAAPAAAGPAPARALIFACDEEEALGASLVVVTGVVRVVDLCHVPLAPRGYRGVIHHERSVLSVWDISLVRGGRPTRGELAVSLDVEGVAAAFLASRVDGVIEGFVGPAKLHPGGVVWSTKSGRDVFFPDFERWLAQAA